MFEAPGFVADRFSIDQITAGVWYIFGCTSSYFVYLRDRSVAIEEQVRCVRGVATCYTDLFERVCCNRGVDPDLELFEQSEIDGAVYMMWDMDCFEGTLAHPQDNPHLIEPGLFVLESALMRCRTSTCRVSALHGIGHLYSRFEDEKDPLADRLRELVDRFVASTTMPDWLAEYAACARDGYVQ
ncbi:MAG: hypothetical protein JNL50_03930 [Phycisphaerae bacterium]|nr:hypothetical protein [Phycisphaerae bacterium]